MAGLFQDDLHNDFGSWPLAYIPFGGADFGEIQAVATAVADGDNDAFYSAWVAAGDRLTGEADASLSRGHSGSARSLYLRASAFYASSFHPLYGAPVDARIPAVYSKQIATFEKGLLLGPHPATPIAIPFGDTTLPGYFIPAEGFESEIRPLVILNGGYDSTVTDLYFLSAVAASRRGYHTLLFDGPGQGAMLYERGVPLRPDWEVVIRAIVDFVETLPIVDASRIALYGASLGGYLAPRGASGEARIAALIADPGTWGIADGFRPIAMRMFNLKAQDVADMGKLDSALIAKMEAFIRGNAQLNWKVVQRGFWTHGVDNLKDFLASAELFTMSGRAERIACPTLIAMAENDTLAAGATAFYEALTCPKTLIRFTAVEGADGHCEMRNRSIFNLRAFDWLDEKFAV
ncbi:alpha/beta hydrolase family protein [Kaistia terrae]|uniref:Alpha/beta hydrolase family protein n=1 Tax=Kaistia terrae TaxID=537017 RepID=A0ABW0PP73_9HYPH|nr:alpha/beta fold hydrolase [Kaistia terrae]MCX5580251.1 alpha/beta fold hydrolase [Kaistia terrae]